MQDPENISEDYGLDDGTFLGQRHVAEITPDPSAMIEEMDISKGDEFRDELEGGVEHVVTEVTTFGDGGTILLDDPEAETEEELFEGGISTHLAGIYAKWRRGDLTILD